MVRIISMLFALISLVGCLPSPSPSLTNTAAYSPNPANIATHTLSPTVSETHTPIPIDTVTPTFTPTVIPVTDEPQVEEIRCKYPEAIDYQTKHGWTRYINSEYCFSFIYPSDWTLITHRHSIRVAKDLLELVIGVRKEVDDVRIMRTGMAAGELIAVGTIQFMGQEIPKEHLVYKEKVKEVIYNHSNMEIPVGGVVFTISGRDNTITLPYEEIEFSDETIRIFDEIVESFQLIE